MSFSKRCTKRNVLQKISGLNRTQTAQSLAAASQNLPRNSGAGKLQCQNRANLLFSWVDPKQPSACSHSFAGFTGTWKARSCCRTRGLRKWKHVSRWKQQETVSFLDERLDMVFHLISDLNRTLCFCSTHSPFGAATQRKNKKDLFHRFQSILQKWHHHFAMHFVKKPFIATPHSLPGQVYSVSSYVGQNHIENELDHAVVWLDKAHVPGAAYTGMSRVSYGKNLLLGGLSIISPLCRTN